MVDRTQEIIALAHSVKSSITESYKHRFIPQTSIPTPEEHFIRETSTLYFSLRETEKQLDTLKECSKKSSLFNAQTQRIQQISDIVEDKIKVAKNKLEEIKNVTMGSQCGETIKQILQQRLFFLTQIYKQILNDRTSLLKETHSRRIDYSFSSSLDFSRPSVPSFMENDGNQAQEELSHLQARTQDIEQVESQLAQLHGLFNQISMMVHEHQIMIERIDSHAESALFNLEKGRVEVVKSYENVVSNRNLSIKVFLVIVLFFTFYVVFLL